MNVNEKNTNWDATKGKLKVQFALLSGTEELAEMQNEILRRIQVKLGKTKEEIEKFISL